MVLKTCAKCNEIKELEYFIKRTNKCKDCNNKMRREHYNNDEEFRKKKLLSDSEYLKRKAIERQKIQEEKQLEIGIDNKKCKYCLEIKHKDRFRHNRLKCRDCERDEPIDKFKRNIRSRIQIALNGKKTKHTIEYLGCSPDEYFDWMFNYSEEYTFDNRSEKWHIDHVIPLSKFDLDDENEQLIAFNWKNTMPLSCQENLKKNNKILPDQIKLHLEKLKEYHLQKNIELPEIYINLLVRHLVAGTPLEL
jgi:hypothetical protein